MQEQKEIKKVRGKTDDNAECKGNLKGKNERNGKRKTKRIYE